MNSIDRYVLAMQRRNLSPNTVDKRRRCLRLFDSEVGLDTTQEAIERWLDGRRLSAKSRAVWLSHLRSFYTYAVAEGLLPADPTAKIRAPKVGRRFPRPVEDRELAKLLANATPRLRAMLLLGSLAGLRCMEIAGLDSEDISQGVLRVIGKGNKERRVPVHGDLAEALDLLPLPATGPVFRQGNGQRASAGGISHELGSYIHSLGVEGGAHRLRHWFGTATYRSTLDLALTRDLMGHADVASTMIYAAADTAKAASAVAGLRIGA